ncbi:transcriptional regulator [Methanosarcina sp. KYL-1]|uniref:hypothetical protein n=1 Tax=Methanosarcina sp. KYL-1 TaxID=2602068 RepID=UPI002101669C|nr:hypothetical protein [Methanosarcina sp. KYL-1]MCQ1536832.1 transcriptional regulator [Methanosarcina sp. KYL-1]
MDNMERTENGARFAQEWSDEDFINAVEEALRKATVSVNEVKDILGCSSQTAKARLLKLKEEGKLEGELKGKAWGFRLPDQERD